MIPELVGLLGSAYHRHGSRTEEGFEVLEQNRITHKRCPLGDDKPLIAIFHKEINI
jgi:hypothetical protein